jgi:hypothetical protein
MRYVFYGWTAYVQFIAGAGIFLSATTSGSALGPPSLLFSGYEDLFSLGVKWLGHEVGNTSSSVVEVKNVWSYTFIPPYIFMTWCFIMYTDNITLYTFLPCISLLY